MLTHRTHTAPGGSTWITLDDDGNTKAVAGPLDPSHLPTKAADYRRLDWNRSHRGILAFEDLMAGRAASA